jgi:hypothetical protein
MSKNIAFICFGFLSLQLFSSLAIRMLTDRIVIDWFWWFCFAFFVFVGVVAMAHSMAWDKKDD